MSLPTPRLLLPTSPSSLPCRRLSSALPFSVRIWLSRVSAKNRFVFIGMKEEGKFQKEATSLKRKKPKCSLAVCRSPGRPGACPQCRPSGSTPKTGRRDMAVYEDTANVLSLHRKETQDSWLSLLLSHRKTTATNM